MFECILSEGYKIIFRAGLAIMKFKEPDLLANNMENNITTIGKSEVYNSYDADEFVATMFNFSMARAEIQGYENEYRLSHQKEMEKM